MKIIFIGMVRLSEVLLKKLIDLNAPISVVLTKRKSAFNSDFVDLSPICEKAGIKCMYIDSINAKHTISLIKEISPDMIFCFGWSELIKKELLGIPTLGVIGYHPALLPKNRGRHPLVWALALGLSETGSTFFFMDSGADSGDILSQKKIKIEYRDNARSLYEKVALVARRQVEDFYPLLLTGRFPRIRQNNMQATSWRKRTVCDGLIDWRMSSLAIYNLVRALAHPYVGAGFLYRDEEIKVWEAKEVKTDKYNNLEPGKVVKRYSRGKLLVKAGDNCIMLSGLKIKGRIHEGEYL